MSYLRINLIESELKNTLLNNKDYVLCVCVKAMCEKKIYEN